MEILISIFALVVSLICANYTRMNISVAYRKDIFEWYGQCIENMMALKFSNVSENEGCALLGKLSALIEKGRYFFPNIDKNDGYGKEKLNPYQGYRCHVLDYLVYYFNLYKNEEQPETAHADVIQRLFCSQRQFFQC